MSCLILERDISDNQILKVKEKENFVDREYKIK